MAKAIAEIFAAGAEVKALASVSNLNPRPIPHPNPHPNPLAKKKKDKLVAAKDSFLKGIDQS